MNRLDPELRSRIFRLMFALLAVVGVSALIALSIARPFAPGQSDNPPTAATTSVAVLAASPTPRPTMTEIPVPTPTLLPASPLPEDGWLVRSNETFERPSTWPAQSESGWSSSYTDGRYLLKLDGQQTISYRVPLDTTEFRISVDVQVDKGYAGLVFLGGDANLLYRFQVDDAGRYRLSRRKGAAVTALIDWTASAALKPGVKAVNSIEVRRVEDKLTLYANETELATFELPKDEKLAAQVGMTLDAVARDQVAQAFFDNLAVRVPVVPSGG